MDNAVNSFNHYDTSMSPADLRILYARMTTECPVAHNKNQPPAEPGRFISRLAMDVISVRGSTSHERRCAQRLLFCCADFQMCN